MCKNTIPESTWLRNLEKGKLCCLIWQRLICTENDYLDSWQVITDEWSFNCTPNGIHVYKHHSADWEFNAERFKWRIQRIQHVGEKKSPKTSKVKFKFKFSGFKLFLPDSIPGSMLSNALCQRHTFNHCNEPLWLNSSVKFNCGFSHSPGRYDAWNSRITTGLWQNTRPKYTLAKS